MGTAKRLAGGWSVALVIAAIVAAIVWIGGWETEPRPTPAQPGGASQFHGKPHFRISPSGLITEHTCDDPQCEMRALEGTGQ